MIAFVEKPILTTYNSVPLEDISIFDKNSAYIKGSQRIYNENIYEALTDIPKTVNHIWNDLDSLDIYGYDLYTDSRIPNPTSVSITNGVTLVYVKSLKKYFLASATTTVNYSTMNWSTPTNFTDLGATPTPLYRTELNYPDGKKNTLYWSYVSGTNRNTMFDGVINKRTINNRFFQTTGTTTFSNTGVITLSNPLSDNIYEEDKILIDGTTLNDGVYKILSISIDRLTITLYTLTVSEVATGSVYFYTQTYVKWTDFGINALSIFNTICESAELTVTSGLTTDTYNISMQDTSFINTFELFCFNEPKNLLKNYTEIRKDYNQQFELTFFGTFQEVGEIIQGISLDIGKAEDSSDLSGRNYNPLIEADNGDVYLQDESKPINVASIKSINLVYDSNLTSLKEEDIKSLMSKRIVLAGSVGNEIDLDILLSYCYITNYRFNPVINDELNKYNLEIREFL